ncbi:hypothetical protein NG895_22100 [Aeoliella sp. ICT_H6.2]|uniref:Homeodomain-like domain-containing protein n=1 Tax=Aeoliella straminimaris TaxID=2954799 RepID=A0A9X2JI07_9BACT|nr:hypothetical protein [Aeoliella straminimaris]MCO6046600.1 hypothetical protein [Aeoliella straminimaris]
MARPCVLDEVKQREICVLVTAGMSLTKIADYVGCDRRTIQRLRKTDEDFDLRMRRAAMAEELAPIQTLRNASKTHWRAAAYMLERKERREAEQRAARERGRIAPNLEHLARAVKQAIAEKVSDPVSELMLQQKIDEIFCNPDAATKPLKRGTRRQRGPSCAASPPWEDARQQSESAVSENDIDDDLLDDVDDEMNDDQSDDKSCYNVSPERLAQMVAEIREQEKDWANVGYVAAAEARAQQPPDWPVGDAATTPTKAGSNERRGAK